MTSNKSDAGGKPKLLLATIAAVVCYSVRAIAGGQGYW